jgi:hypothetical protein
MLLEPQFHCTKAEKLRAALNLPTNAFKFSNGWINEFKKHHALQHHQNHGEASSVNLYV